MIIALSRRSLDPYELAEIGMFRLPSGRSAPRRWQEALSLPSSWNAALLRLILTAFWSGFMTSSIHRECFVAASAVAAYFRSLLERSDFARYSEYEYCLHYYGSAVH